MLLPGMIRNNTVVLMLCRNVILLRLSPIVPFIPSNSLENKFQIQTTAIMKSLLKIYLLRIFLFVSCYSFGQELEPGVDRWRIKVSAENFISNDDAKPVSLKKLLALPLLDKKYSTGDFDSVLIPKKLNSLKEGDIISTEGYLHLVALEKASDTHRDGDYHIQITLHPQWTDSCFIVEIPYEEFASNDDLKPLFQKGRTFIRKRLLHDENKEPSTSGNVMQSEVYVKVTGQLFYDAIHAKDMRKGKFRGKKGKMKKAMHSYTAWEIHPVTKIEFAPKPK